MPNLRLQESRLLVRLLTASACASLALTLWSLVFWGLLPATSLIFSPLPPAAQKVAPVLKEVVPRSGTYLSPWLEADDGAATAHETFLRKHKAGPLIQIFYRKEGVDGSSPVVVLAGLGHAFVYALATGWLLIMVESSLPRYWRRVEFVTTTGLVAAVMIDLWYPIWFHHPWTYYLVAGIFHIGNGFVAGLVLAAFTRAASSEPKSLANQSR